MKRAWIVFALVGCVLFAEKKQDSKPIVTIKFQGQLGNQLFQTAAAYSVALDNNCQLVFPLSYMNQPQCEIMENVKNVFWSIPVESIEHKIRNGYEQLPENNYAPIPYYPNLCLKGFFESEKFFRHHAEEIKQLFAPSEKIVSYLQSKYAYIIDSQKTVGVHVRTYYYDWLKSKQPYMQAGIRNPLKHLFSMLPAPDIEFYKKAISHFPSDYEFIVFSDYIPWAKEFLSSIPRKFTFIENEKQYHDLYLLSFCKHQIFSNSTFAWWGAYLNNNPNKIIIVRYPWTYVQTRNIQDIIPEGWFLLMGNPSSPIPQYP